MGASMPHTPLIPADAGIQTLPHKNKNRMPAFAGMSGTWRSYFFSSISVPLWPITRCAAWAKRASSQGSVISSRTPAS